MFKPELVEKLNSPRKEYRTVRVIFESTRTILLTGMRTLFRLGIVRSRHGLLKNAVRKQLPTERIRKSIGRYHYLINKSDNIRYDRRKRLMYVLIE